MNQISGWLLGDLSGFTDLTLLALRVLIGGCFVVHGLGKLGLVGPGKSQPRGSVLAGFAGWLKSLGVPFPELQARMAMLSELVGGTLIALGLFTRVGLLACFATMVVAGLVGHRGGGYLITNNPPGAEYTINLAAICAGLFVFGPGKYALDFYFFG